MPYYPPIFSSDIPYEAPRGAQFDNSAYLGKAAPTSASKGTLSLWFAGTAATGNNSALFLYTSVGVSEDNNIVIGSNGVYGFVAYHQRVGSTAREYRTVAAAALASKFDGNWHHLIYSWDHAGDTYSLYIDDVEVTLSDALSDTISQPTVAADSVIIGAYSIYRSKLAKADYYYLSGTALDLSVAANRRKFISSRGLPVYLGEQGNKPGLGTPSVYLHGSGTDFRFNDGTVGDMNALGDALTVPTIRSATHPG